MKMPQWAIRWFGRRLAAGSANCLIYALYMHQEHGWKMVFQRTTHNRISWLVWWHVLAKPPQCPLTGAECAGEEAFEPLDYKDRILPPPLFKGRVVRKGDPST